MSKTDITVIMPIFELDEKLFQNALASIDKQLVKPDSVLFVVAEGSKDHKFIKKHIMHDKEVAEYIGLNFEIVAHKDDTSFQSQMNLGVKSCSTKWFCFLEQDDEISSIWLDNVVKYRDVYDDVTVFLPLVLDVTDEQDKLDEDGKVIGKESEVIGLTNEAVWAAEFSDEMGILDNTALIKHQNFNFCGMVMMKEMYEDFGGIKNNIQLTFMYEFLLRLTNESAKVMVIPKIGYKHVNMRKGGLFHKLKNELSKDEARWWLATAKREFYHLQDRDLKYENLTV
jgi:glycosyltransferase involved in cell wall biosynthesis